MRILITRFLIWILRKIKVSLVIGININYKLKSCSPKFNINFIYDSDFIGIGYKGWKEAENCSIKNLTPIRGKDTVVAFEMSTEKQGRD